MWEPLLQLSPMGTAPILLPLLFLFPSFFILPGYMGIFLVLLGVRGPLLVFSRCSVRIVPFVDVVSMHLWGEMNSMSSYSSTILTPSLPRYSDVHQMWRLLFCCTVRQLY